MSKQTKNAAKDLWWITKSSVLSRKVQHCTLLVHWRWDVSSNISILAIFLYTLIMDSDGFRLGATSKAMLSNQVSYPLFTIQTLCTLYAE